MEQEGIFFLTCTIEFVSQITIKLSEIRKLFK